MYKIVSECNINEVWAIGYYSREKAQAKIDEGYFHKMMYPRDRHKKLIVIPQHPNKL